MMHLLNARQKAILEYIVEFYKAKRYPAIIADIAEHFKIPNGSASATVATLAKYGYVDWIFERKRTRAIFPLCTE